MRRSCAEELFYPVAVSTPATPLAAALRFGELEPVKTQVGGVYSATLPQAFLLWCMRLCVRALPTQATAPPAPRSLTTMWVPTWSRASCTPRLGGIYSGAFFPGLRAALPGAPALRSGDLAGSIC